MSNIFNDNFFVFKNIDLKDIGEIIIKCSLRSDIEIGGKLEIRIDNFDGMLLEELEISKSEKKKIPILSKNDFHDIYLIFKSTGDSAKPIASFEWIEFNPNK